MDSTSGPQIPKLRCSPFHTTLSVDPIGSASAYDAYLCVEVDLPWQRDISMSEPFASLCNPPAASIQGADGRRWRPQGLVPRRRAEEHGDYPVGEGSRSTQPGVEVVAWERSSASARSVAGDLSHGEASPLIRNEWLVDPSDVPSLAAAILSADPGRLGAFDQQQMHRTQSALYVCTHGQRDVCCGGIGGDLYGELVEAGPIDGVEIRRCSHTGGHRFAATAISFPDGYAWAHLDTELATAIAQRSAHPKELASNCRGSTLLPSGPAQVADRYGLTQLGWEWADASRRVELIGFERRTMATDLIITADMPSGSTAAFEVRVGIETHVPQITCGSISGPEYTVEPIWRVEGARELKTS